ncbi:two-component regulator propeller domain-containing protein [Marivirga salinae]|uniref:histidine kinase n=1 Tax=Marivirga salinarum TaxID=3059078 RepID=A0AA49GAS4_9BACT|nr:two-component regulator propeller domain-containing protein [Marivirga sp. BDSF4-3]WKK75922.2 two-component regulator propeller domain-containing protein [Marivirga sp. BDSF4-3]
MNKKSNRGNMIGSVLKRCSFLTFLFLNFIDYTYAQSVSKDPVPLKRLMATEWSVKSAGLVANNVTNVLQSHSGYIWLTTYNGVQKFDGYKTITFDQNELSFLRSSGFRNIYHSPVGHTLYFSSQSSGLVQYDEDSGFKQLKATHGEMPSSVEDVIIDRKGDMWIGSVNQGLFIFSGDSIYKFQHEIIENSNVLSLYEAKNGSIYIGTEGNGIFLIKDHEVKAHYNINNGLKSNIVNVISQIGDSIIAGTQSGINYIVNDKLSFSKFMEGESVNAILLSEQFLWAGSDNGLGRIDLKSGREEFVSSSGFIDMTRINDIMLDSEGSYWLATGRNGLVQLKETGIINFNRFDGLENDNINIVTQRKNGKGYFIGCDDGNIFTLNSNQIKPYEIKNAIKPTGIRDVYEQADGTVWIASYKGLLRKNGASEKMYGLLDGLPSLDLRRILEDKNGNIWVASRSGGLIKIQDEKVVKVYDRGNGLKADFILSIEEDEKGQLYLGTHSGGVVIINTNENVENISLTDNDQGIIVFNTHIDSPDVLWAVTTAGLFYVNGQKIKELTFARSYSGLSMFDWLEDDNGNVWITTNRGIIYVDKDEINKFLNKPDYKVSSRLITESDGMYDDECTGAVRSLKSNKGKLLIPTLGGVSVVSPEKINMNTDLPKVYVENLETQDSTYENQTNIKVHSQVNRYKFNYTSLSFLAPDLTRFKYKLEGFDPAFTEVSGVRSAEYTNLPPGKYTFLLFATNNHGLWTKQPAKFYFEVKPAFYETFWFYFLLALITFFLVYAIYNWRVSGIQKMNKKLMKVNSELDGFVYSASHDLRSPLASLLGLINLSRKDPTNTFDYLDKMEKSVKRLDDFIAEIIDFSSNERKEVVCDEVDFESTVYSIIDELSFLDSEDKIAKKVNIDQNGLFISDKRRIAVIFRNLISNALKYYDDSKDEPHLNIEVESNSGFARILIEDNGIGISKEDQEEVFKMFYRATERSTGSGLGLYIILETVEKLRGSIKMESEKYKGTSFHIEIPNLDPKNGKNCSSK